MPWAFSLEVGGTRWGGDAKLNYWKASTSYEHGIRFFRRHNLIVRAGGTAGDNLPLWTENSAGGTNLRGYLYRQFQGDTHLRTQVEYHFPLFSLWGLDVRGLLLQRRCRYLVSQAAVDRPRHRHLPATQRRPPVLATRLSPSGVRAARGSAQLGGRGRAFLFADRSHATRRCGRGQRPGHQGCAHDSGSRRLGSMWQITNRSQAVDSRRR